METASRMRMSRSIPSATPVSYTHLDVYKRQVLKIVSMGMSSFAAGFTNSVVAVACNATLQTWGGDLYVGVMTVIHSVREIAENLVKGLTGGSQPVLGYNFGAGQYDRVKRCV